MALLSCGDGTKPAPIVTLTSDAAVVALGQRVMLTWTSRYASACTAEGAWSGSKPANGSELVPVPLTESRSSFAVVCSSGARIARAEVVVTIRPPRFSLQALPLSVAVDLNDAGDVLGYESDDYDDPAVWTPTGMLRIDAPCGTSCPEGYQSTLWAINNHRTVLVRDQMGPGVSSWRLIALGGQALPGGGLPINHLRALNDSLQVVGQGYSGFQLGVPPPDDDAVLIHAGQVTVVQPPGGLSGRATAINAAGVVAGYYRNTPGIDEPSRVFRYANGLSIDLGTLLDAWPTPSGINSAGTIVGELVLPSGDVRAFRVRGGAGSLEVLSDLGGGQSLAAGVNDLEQVVGASTLARAPDTWRATLLSAGTLYDLNELVVHAAGIVLEQGIDANRDGQVLAVGCDATGEGCRPYLLTPVTGP
jgi:hypothetical protein